MSVPQFVGLDPRRSRLRATVESIEAAISLLPVEAGPNPRPSALVAAWRDLVDQLALGPEPEVRACPACHHICMRDATACGHCFRPLPPLGPLPDSPATA